MSTMAFVQPAAVLKRFAYSDEHYVKGLNAETLAKVRHHGSGEAATQRSECLQG